MRRFLRKTKKAAFQRPFVEHRTSKRLKLSGLEPGAAISRDIFMVGVYTAQRISDKYDYFD